MIAIVWHLRIAEHGEQRGEADGMSVPGCGCCTSQTGSKGKISREPFEADGMQQVHAKLPWCKTAAPSLDASFFTFIFFLVSDGKSFSFNIKQMCRHGCPVAEFVF